MAKVSTFTTCLITLQLWKEQEMYGATQIVKVGQDLPMPILITTWARGQDIVRGPEALPKDISIFIFFYFAFLCFIDESVLWLCSYMHFTFEDDSRDLEVTLGIISFSFILSCQIIVFLIVLDVASDSTTWQFYSKIYYPLKPVKEVSSRFLPIRNDD